MPSPLLPSPPSDPSNPIRLLREQEVAAMTSLSLSAIRNWRTSGKGGPKYMRIGRSIRYRLTDVAEWIASQPTGGGGKDNVKRQRE